MLQATEMQLALSHLTDEIAVGPQTFSRKPIRVVVEILVPFGVPVIIRHLLFKVPK